MPIGVGADCGSLDPDRSAGDWFAIVFDSTNDRCILRTSAENQNQQQRMPDRCANVRIRLQAFRKSRYRFTLICVNVDHLIEYIRYALQTECKQSPIQCSHPSFPLRSQIAKINGTVSAKLARTPINVRIGAS